MSCITTTNAISEAANAVSWRDSKPNPVTFTLRHYKVVNTCGQLSSGLSLLVEQTGSLASADPCDKIYGLLGLCHADERNHPSLYVDYTEPFEVMRLRITRYFLSNGAQFVLYRSVGCDSEAPSPSWTFNFGATEVDTLDESILADGTCSDDLFSAGYPPCEATQRASSPLISDDSPLLTLSAILLPTICTVSSPLAFTTHGADRSVIQKWTSHLLGWAVEQGILVGVDFLAALASTVSADTFDYLGQTHRISSDAMFPGSGALTASFWDAIKYIKDGVSRIDFPPDLDMRSSAIFTSLVGFATDRAVAIATPTEGLEPLLYLVPGCTEAGDVVAVFRSQKRARRDPYFGW
ncbi:hypothetical protein LTR10_013810 [Elasticomyces elasticus]|uniref:Uncharacterized protein n=1 Tax=Exophiala sideris TaxID=1016849 RepID=A0ABR0JGC8_9EURO|nr:hypothetical protein LTR10_013810 [Elasticomyces elasticus]KAK5033214.1 hypothetical protein LTS07_003515 [Exophiala sideris]KAK5042288.1 hypothetical protein LTR13_002094 [Exophiala sideris]KAK5063758.1 hypothetical protein LTR69_003523 [Exophiala sideris]KAK5185556.1 hypothetical protein LTR44_002545 [Eurotiomycetes sp. CCFEE 6388]